MRNAIFAVVQTFDSDPRASEQLLRRLLALERVEQYGYEDIPDVAHELPPLHGSAPDFCADVYEIAFSRDETSDEKTVWTTGVVGITSFRAQDWRGARYALAQDYGSFLEQSPEAAVQALIAVRTAFVDRRGYGRLAGDEPQEVDVGGRHTAFIPDAGMSDIYVQEDESTVLAAFTERLKLLAEGRPPTPSRSSTSSWPDKRLLRCGGACSSSAPNIPRSCTVSSPSCARHQLFCRPVTSLQRFHSSLRPRTGFSKRTNVDRSRTPSSPWTPRGGASTTATSFSLRSPRS